VKTPCRSSKCVHPQCFDATSWYSVMEQTTTWLCPVCEKILDPGDLIIDGYACDIPVHLFKNLTSRSRYFDSILKAAPDSVEDVVVESNGEWHTADNKYGSSTWKAQHLPASNSSGRPLTPHKSLLPKTPPRSPQKTMSAGDDKSHISRNVEILVLDDSDGEEDRVKRELSPSFGSGSSISQTLNQSGVSVPQSQADEVIDLTLDSSDDEDIPVSKSLGKRKADDAGFVSNTSTDLTWKKGRVDLPPLASLSNNTGGDYAPSLTRNPTSRSTFLSAPVHRTASTTTPASAFASSTLPPVYTNGYSARTDSRVQLPPPPQGARLNGSSYNRWQ
jgi:E3 SUMO-protein ligase PIAS1